MNAAEHIESGYEDIAALCKAIGDTLRLEIVRALKTDSFGVLELCDIFEIKQSSMSHHLKVLASAGVLNTRREGNSIFYRRALIHAHLAHGLLLRDLFESIDNLSLPLSTTRRIQQVKSTRAETARNFFNRCAEEFRQNQQQIAPYEQYAESVISLIRKDHSARHETVLEIGPGQGEFLTELAPDFSQVIALDIAEEMLADAESLASQEQLNNIEFILGDTHTALAQELKADVIVCNMVLHHVPSPADVFTDCSALLNDGGFLVVTDLCRHNQSWVRESCGDLWLGFEHEELTHWANRANLEESDSLFQAQRNGFEIQIRKFNKVITKPNKRNHHS